MQYGRGQMSEIGSTRREVSTPLSAVSLPRQIIALSYVCSANRPNLLFTFILYRRILLKSLEKIGLRNVTVRFLTTFYIAFC